MGRRMTDEALIPLNLPMIHLTYPITPTPLVNSWPWARRLEGEGHVLRFLRAERHARRLRAEFRATLRWCRCRAAGSSLELAVLIG